MHPQETTTVRPATVAIDLATWRDCLSINLVALECGNAQGRSLAQANLRRMAELADLAIAAVRTLERIISTDHVRGDDVVAVMGEAQRLSTARPTSVVGAAASTSITPPDMPESIDGIGIGLVAKRISGLDLPLTVCHCGRGWYIGTLCDAQPYTRESDEYWDNYPAASQALKLGIWTQRVAP
jgi:hypothetical protein